MKDTLIRVENLSKSYKAFKAVDGLNFSILKGETFGLVGESGCGKSTTGKMIMQLERPSGGRVFMDGVDLGKQSAKDLLPIRHRFQMIFQNPYGSFNPKMTVYDILREPLTLRPMSESVRYKRIQELLDYVGMTSKFLGRYPKELSGGQNQRIAIARALASEPDFIVADEAVSALDVSIQAQILNLLLDLQKILNLTYLFISHDLSVVEYMSNRVAVMYLGKIVEIAKCEDLYKSPLHPYTQLLISTIPIADPKVQLSCQGLVRDLEIGQNPSGACAFYNRCPYGSERCLQQIPELKAHSPGHFVACHKNNIKE
jgi:oligopeptide/dipeptide ABC transporter ATP-binding protein